MPDATNMGRMNANKKGRPFGQPYGVKDGARTHDPRNHNPML